MGGTGGSSKVVPFNMDALKPFMPSVFGGPYNAQGAYQNAQMIASKYPWITPPAGAFQGAQPGQFAGAGTGVPAPQPPIPPTVQPSGNPQAMAQGDTNAMQPAPLQQILSVLMAGQPSGGK